MDGCSIYIHIPFCVRKCLYCDFLSGCYDEDIQNEYMKALTDEIIACKRDDLFIKTIYIGGGTPSSIKPEWIYKILNTLRSSFNVDENAEISMEMNPGTESREKLNIYRQAGINRLSIGCQSLIDDELHELGRIHSADDFRSCYADARECGFDNINIDIMSALPGQTVKSYMTTVQEICELKPEHISAYSLIIEEGTEFFKRYGDVSVKDCYDIELTAQNAYPKLPDEESERRMYDMTKSYLSDHGYHRYEISNYAADSIDENGIETGKYECRHNKVYWQRGQYLGFGIGAASMYGNVRYNNIHDIRKYISAIEEYRESSVTESGESSVTECGKSSVMKSGKSSVTEYRESSVTESGKELSEVHKSDFSGVHENIEKLNVHAQMEEFMFLGLRMTSGISIQAFEDEFLFPVNKIYGRVINDLETEGLLIQTGDRLKLTERGIAVSNYAMAKFLFD